MEAALEQEKQTNDISRDGKPDVMTHLANMTQQHLTLPPRTVTRGGIDSWKLPIRLVAGIKSLSIVNCN